MKPPFEGDKFLEQWMEQTIRLWDIHTVFETGTELGATAEWFSRRVPAVWTCDVMCLLESGRSFLPNVRYYSNMASHLLIAEAYDELAPHNTLFWLDAHSCPTSCALPDELDLLATRQHQASRLIAIHDFKVPTAELGFDSYDKLGDLGFDLVNPYMSRIYPGGYNVVLNTQATGAKRGVALFTPLT
jgi:hypothetical protein